MPFTLSHAAATLPIKWRLGSRADFPALAIGSMAPDFPYFLGLPLPRGATHSLIGALWFALPMGLLAWLLWRGLLRLPIRMLAPAAIGRRIPLRPPSAPSFLILASSICLGALTHVLWDAFTHGSGFGVEELPILGQALADLPSYEVHDFHLLQHGSTLLGALALVIATRRWIAITPVSVTSDGVSSWRRRGARLAFAFLPPLIGLAYAFSTTPLVASLFYIRLFVGRGAVAAMSACLLTLTFLGILERLGAFRSSLTPQAFDPSDV
ncbi:MAG: DUF4184 family protein [Deltaproteobacteria bacterium]|nr:DUF4184 family protein [Deltaproteobacteria bacterium]